MTLKKGESLLEEEAEAEEENSNAINVARWEIDLLSVQITRKQDQGMFCYSKNGRINKGTIG